MRGFYLIGSHLRNLGQLQRKMKPTERQALRKRLVLGGPRSGQPQTRTDGLTNCALSVRPSVVLEINPRRLQTVGHYCWGISFRSSSRRRERSELDAAWHTRTARSRGSCVQNYGRAG
jgi:hypothetical protein